MSTMDSLEVQDLFDQLSARYDLLNDLFSFGMHRLWKKKLLKVLRPSQGEKWLDLCCGTGDLTIALANLVVPNGKVVGIDSARNTLLIAKKKVAKQPGLSIEWVNKDLFDEDLEFRNYDGVVMAYGLRNLIDPLSGLKLIRKFLKPEGRAGILDFNPMFDNSFKAWFQKVYLRKFVIPVASALGFNEHFSYLEKSLRIFPDGKSQESLARNAGFQKASHFSIAGGQMGILLLKN